MRIDFLGAEDPRWPDWLSEMRYDIYHLPVYVRFAATRQEVGEPLMFVAQEAGHRLLVPLIVRPSPAQLAGDTRPSFDAICPRGYPGLWRDWRIGAMPTTSLGRSGSGTS